MIYKGLFFIMGFALVSSAHAEPCYNPSVVVDGGNSGEIFFQGGQGFDLHDSDELPAQLLIPDAEGKRFLRIPIVENGEPSSEYLNAHELRLKVRDLATQLLESWDSNNLKNMVAYFATFTPPYDANLPNVFGQYMRDTLTHEFSIRGMPVQEYRAQKYIEGDASFSFVMRQEKFNVSVNSPRAAVISGTYYYDQDYLYIIARMVRGSDGMVLRTAQTTIPMSGLVDRMTSPMHRKPLEFGTLSIGKGK